MPDIRNTGALNWRALQQANAEKFNPETATNEDWIREAVRVGKSKNVYTPAASEGVGIQAAQVGYGDSQYDDAVSTESQLENLGEVRYNEQPWYDTLANGVGKMLGTAGTTFVSSLVGLPYGLYEVVKSAVEGDTRWSALWDNDVTQGLSEVDNWLEENMTNYRSQVQQNSPWYSPENLFSMNFIADDIIKNAGFTLGAAASMAVGSGSLGLMGRALGFVNDVGKTTKGGAALLSALFSATGEGMIEAKQGVDERNKLEMQRLDDALTPEYQALEMQKQEIDNQYAMTGDYQAYRQQMQDWAMQKQTLDDRKAAGQQQIIESGQEMGNTILLANQGLLTLGNLIQFGKGMVKSFDSARHAAEVSSKAAKPLGVSATRVSKNIKDGYELTGKNFGRAIAATKGLLTEGSEEMNQQWAQSGAGAYYTEKDVNDYWKARLDPDSYRETTKGLYTFGQALDRGFQESWGDFDQWEQFVIGGLTGMAGSYTPTKLFNQDKTKSRWNPTRYGSWEGGAIKEIWGKKGFNAQYNQYQQNVDDLNKILQSEDFPARMQSMVGHTFLETQKADAVNADDMKAWKDADDKQNIHDIQAFLRAGRLDDLRAIYQEMGSNLSDDEIDNIVKSTTKEISAEEDKQNFDRTTDEIIARHQRKITELQQQAQNIGDSQEGLVGSERTDYQAAVAPALENIFKQIDDEYDAIDKLNQQKQDYVGQKRYEGAYVDDKGNRTATNDEIRETVKHNSEELNRKLNSYLDSINTVNEDTKGALTKDQEDNLAYLHNLGKESLVRADKIISDKRKQMPSKFLMKTDKTSEQLSKEYASSDLVFNKDENTKEGYVEVDTSMLDDRSFRNFFIGEILWGGNINPEFAETADEKAAREEEEKNLSDEEKKKKARERLSKKWKDALEKQKKDAEEQRDVNGDLLTQHFVENYLKSNNASQAEVQEALNDFFQDILDANTLVAQAGQYDKTLREYMANPGKVDEDKAKEESKAQKAEDEKQVKNKFAGKDSKQMKQELTAGDIGMDDFEDFIGADLSNVEDDDLKKAQDEAKKAQESMQKANALKQHIQDQLGDNPTEDEIKEAQKAMQKIDNALLESDEAADINMDSPQILAPVVDDDDYINASVDDIEEENDKVLNRIADAMTAFEEDKNAQDDIPDTAPAGALDDVEMPTTGHDETAKTDPEVVAPKVSSPSKAAQNPIPKNPLTPTALNNIVSATSNATKSNTAGTWRSTTTRHPYGRSTGTYHETLPNKGIEYKRSKAIWEYLNGLGAFDRVENADNDRIKQGDTIHFMVKNFAQEMYGKDFGELNDEERVYSLAIIMLDDEGEVLGDLPLAELEPSFKSGNPTQQVKDLKALQDKVFNKYVGNYEMHGTNEAIVDSELHLPGVDNLNLTFDNGKKTPLLSRVKQVMRGVVPYSYGETNTLNEVIQGTPEIGIKVADTTVAIKRGDKTPHKEIVVPNVGSQGQPYMLLPTASGEKIAVPFYMPAFDAEQHRNTELYKQLVNSVFSLLTNNSQATASQKKDFLEHLDMLKGLLQVEEQKGVKIVDVKKDSITLHLQSLTDENMKINIQVPVSGDSTSTTVAAALVDKMTGISINVSLQYINDTIQAGGREVEYNSVIGEIANVNLPKATTHTVNSWFTVELTTRAGTKPSKTVTTKTTGVVTEVIKGRSIEIDTDKLTAVDTATGEIIEDDEDVNLRLAQIKAEKPLYKGKDFIKVNINGEARTYDVKNNKFVKPTSVEKETSAQPTKSAEETPDVSDVEAPKKIERFDSTPEAVSFTEQKNSIIIPKDTTGFGFENTSQGFIKNKHGIWVPVVSHMRSGYILEDGTTVLGGTLKSAEALLEKGRVVIQDGAGGHLEISADMVIGLVKSVDGNRATSTSSRKFNITEEIQKQVASFNNPSYQAKTLEQIESEMKDKKVVNRQTKDAWAAIPDALKLKLVNEGAGLTLKYRNISITVSMSNKENLIRELTDANMAAKAGRLEVTEATKYRKVDSKEKKAANIQREKRWLQQNLPMFSNEERLKMIQGLIEIPGDEGWAWGRYQSGIITLSNMAAAGTAYHEAFHAVTQTLLDDDELNTLYDAARERYEENDVALLEELLAEDFRRYVQREETPIIGTIRKFFRRLLHAMRSFQQYKDPINQLFYKINNGEFKDTLPRVPRGDNAFYSKEPEGVFISEDDPAYKIIKKEFDAMHLESNKPWTLGDRWTAFKKRWIAKGYTPVAKYSRDVYGKGRNGYRWFGVQTNMEAAKSYTKDRSAKTKEYIAVKQSREGMMEMLKWERLTPEQQMNMMDDGMTQKKYESLSLEEKEQWVKCRT